MAWHVVVEPPGMAPFVADVKMRHSDAVDLAKRVAWAFRSRKGTTVTVVDPESTDQLQLSRRGPVRDQPSLPAIGQDLTVIVPTATRLIR